MKVSIFGRLKRLVRVSWIMAMVASSLLPALTGAADTALPSRPGGFTAVMEGDTVKLTWQASSDDASGVEQYLIERSTDGRNWSPISDVIEGTSHVDRSAGFNVRYFYRIRAKDRAGRLSESSVIEIVTNRASSAADGTADKVDVTAESEDGIVSLKMPGEGDNEGARCTFKLDDDKRGLESRVFEVAVGPYDVLCNDRGGRQMFEFDTEAVYTVRLERPILRSYSEFAVLTKADGGDWQRAQHEFDQSTGEITVVSRDAISIVVMGAVPKGIPWTFIIIIVAVAGGIGLWALMRYRRDQRLAYEEYLRRKYYDI